MQDVEALVATTSAFEVTPFFLTPFYHQRRLIGEFVLVYLHLKAGKDGVIYSFLY